MVNDWDQYQDAAASTAFYPHVGETEVGRLVYPVMGLNGEIGELFSALYDTRFGTDALEAERRADWIRKEAGDVLWYIAAISRELGLRMSSLVNDADQLRPASTFCDGMKFSEPSIAMMVDAAGISETAKKALRDSAGILHDYVRANIITRLIHVFHHLTDLATQIQLTPNLATIADANIAKLADRKRRGVLKGSGDFR